jgi:DNA-binding transcriptional MerR regulator
MIDNSLRHMPRIGISEAMRLFGLTARALRFYEERGLITARRDRMNCRYYDAAGRQRLAWIASLRTAGVSLTDIADVLDAEENQGQGRESAMAKLRARREAVAAELVNVEAALDRMSAETSGPLRLSRAQA